MSRTVRGSSGVRGEAGSGGRLPEHPACPFCEGTRTELVSAFGSHASVATYWCGNCRSPFEMLKWRGGGRGDPGTPESGAGP